MQARRDPAVKSALGSFERRLVCLFVILALASTIDIYARAWRVHLTLQMAASGPSMAQLFYDTGNGFNENDTGVVKVTSGSLSSFQPLSFNLPRKTVFRLRFDPLTNAGQVVIRSVQIDSRGSVIKAFPVSEIVAFNQMATRTLNGDAVEFTTVPGATDSSVRIELAKPLRLRRMVILQRTGVAAVIDLILAFLCFLLLRLKTRVLQNSDALVAATRQINRKFELFALGFSHGEFLKLDATAIWVYLGIATLFCLACLLDLNGSSAGYYPTYGAGPQTKMLLGAPRSIRADEWAYVTPDILNQYFRRSPFAVEDSELGDHDIALTGNLPVKHITTLFRPQFWAFFALPVDYAFSIYWQAKALLLMVGIFTFLLWISRSSFWSLAGALWYLFSPFTQWSFSWPSAMPEMVGSLCLGVVSLCYLTVGRNSRWLVVAAVGTVFSGVDFAMCAYPPHLIPLAWVGLLMTVAWCLARWKEIFGRVAWGRRMTAILLAGFALMTIGLIAYLDLRVAITAVANTLYPGRRLLPSGIFPVWGFGSQFLQWTEKENRFPQVLGNICEGSGFLWLAPFTLFCLGRVSLSQFQRTASVALAVCLAFMFAWCAFPLPAILGRITGLDRCTPARCMPALGLMNIAIVSIILPSCKRWRFRSLKVDIAIVLAAAGLLFWWFLRVNQHLDRFFSTGQLVWAALVAAVLATLLVSGRSRLLALCVVVPEVFIFGTVNPVERGLPEFTQSELHEFVQNHRELLSAKWLMYSDTPVRSGFLAAEGAAVYTGTRYIPDIDHFAWFASRGLDLNVFNRLGYLDAHPIKPGQATRFVLGSPVVVEWDVTPTDPLLRLLGIRYVAFDTKPNPDLTQGLTPLNSAPVDGLWLYRIGNEPK